MKKRMLIGAAVLLVLYFTYGLSTRHQHGRQVSNPEAISDPVAPTLECGTVQAYAMSKGLVQQCVHSQSDVVFPSYTEEYVHADHLGNFAVTGYFYRNGSKVLYKASLRCVGDEWQVSWLNINGTIATPGMNL